MPGIVPCLPARNNGCSFQTFFPNSLAHTYINRQLVDVGVYKLFIISICYLIKIQTCLLHKAAMQYQKHASFHNVLSLTVREHDLFTITATHCHITVLFTHWSYYDTDRNSINISGINPCKQVAPADDYVICVMSACCCICLVSVCIYRTKQWREIPTQTVLCVTHNVSIVRQS